ncbi:MarR family transcriptional regulator [Nocardia elegans]|jgi:DNA-binding MarR family transcriptional regulator|uniref:MarR family winged helix-turn-helix transcriptional regulator n=1 Tax=Nocardia elegans TaxID=300029 RepID=A0ABW6T8U5_9NOCA|nr:MarR family transcriptional regulator [Nocardia elegans]MBF6242808.1 MarR family transcriptional regulator [Nocardia elegans]MBF6449443.1 MarR family transcriptional regulator [Nocardia elegans]
MQGHEETAASAADAAPAQSTTAEIAALEALTRMLVSIAWDSAHAAPPGVTFPQMRFLLILQALGRVSSSRLAAALGVNASSVTRLADKLEGRGYVARGTDAHNRSVVTIEVTTAGQAVVDQVLQRRKVAFGSLLDGLTPEARDRVIVVARDLVQAAATTPFVTATGPGSL